MKKLTMLWLLIFQAVFIFSQTIGSYPTQNGEIIEERKEGDALIIIRRHIQTIIVWDYSGYGHDEGFSRNYNFLSEPRENASLIFRIMANVPGESFDTLEILIKTYSDTKLNELWVKGQGKNGQIGWVKIDNINPDMPDPYWNNNGKISEIFTINDKTWTAITMAFEPNQVVYFWGEEGKLNARDRPGTVNTNVLFQLSAWDRIQLLSETIEMETIDGRTAEWCKIRDERGRTGWVFGYYLSLGYESSYSPPSTSPKGHLQSLFE